MPDQGDGVLKYGVGHEGDWSLYASTSEPNGGGNLC